MNIMKNSLNQVKYNENSYMISCTQQIQMLIAQIQAKL